MIHLDVGNHPNPFDALSIHDAQGRKLYQNKVSHAENYTLSTQLQPGIYLLNIHHQNRLVSTHKLIVRY